MLETIREYGLEVLAANGEMEASLHAHARYYLALAEEAEPQLSGAEQARWVAELEREQENVRAAVSYLLERARRRARRRLSWLCACVSPCPGSGTTGAMGEK